VALLFAGMESPFFANFAQPFASFAVKILTAKFGEKGRGARKAVRREL